MTKTGSCWRDWWRDPNSQDFLFRTLPSFLSTPSLPAFLHCLSFMFMHVLVLVVMPPMTSVAC